MRHLLANFCIRLNFFPFPYRKAPYPTISIQTDQEYLVTRQGPRVRLIKEGRPVYQDAVPPLIPMNVQNL